MTELTYSDLSPVSAGTVIATWGGESSNSYASYSYAADWIASNVIDTTAWDSATETQKNAALSEATRQIDAKQFVWNRATSTQALEAPREYADQTECDKQEAAFAKACCVQANQLLKTLLTGNHAVLIAQGVKSFEKTVGPIQERYDYAVAGEMSDLSSKASSGLCRAALDYLQPWLDSRRILRG